MRFQFFKTMLPMSLLIALAIAYPLYAWCTVDIRSAIIASAIIAFTNAALAGLALEYAFNKSNKIFMIAVFGGMGIRMALILVALTILLLNGFHALSLALSLMGFYLLFMIYEIIYITRELSRRKSYVPKPKRAMQTPTSFRSRSLSPRGN